MAKLQQADCLLFACRVNNLPKPTGKTGFFPIRSGESPSLQERVLQVLWVPGTDHAEISTQTVVFTMDEGCNQHEVERLL